MHKESHFLSRKVIINIPALCICACFAYFLIFHAATAINSIVEATFSCLTVIVPALFAFMVLSTFLLKSGLYQLLSIPFYPISKYVFKIEPSLFSIFILSQIGGYPIGVKLISELIKSGEITIKDADKMLCYCFCSGPSFIIGIISLRLYNSVSIGLIMFMSITITNITIAVFIGLFSKVGKYKKRNIRINISSGSLINSINSSTKSLFSVCSIIVIFNVFISMLDTFNIISTISDFIAKILSSNSYEVSNVIRGFVEISSLSRISGANLSIPLVTGLISFGGICVIMQISSVSKERLCLRRFMLSRLIAMILSSQLCRYFLYLYSPSIPTWKGAIRHTVDNPSSPIPSIILLVMTFFLLSTKSVENNEGI